MLSTKCTVLMIAAALAANAISAPALNAQTNLPVDRAAYSKDPDAVRTAEVTIDGGTLWRTALVGSAVPMRLFDDADFTLVVQHRWETPGGFAVAGSIEGPAGGMFSLAVEEDQISATISVGRRHFGLVPTGRADATGWGVCTARELNPGAALRCAMTPGVRPVSRTDRLGMRAIGQEQHTIHIPAVAAAGGGGGGQPPGGACDCADDQSIVDLLAVYTPAGLAGAGGLPALTARLQDGIAEANLSYINSNITAGGPVNRLTVRLSAVQPIAYDEVSPNWLDHLDRVTNPTDGFMDGVHAQRNAHHGDIVALVVEDARFTGGAAFYATYSDASAFAVLNWRALGGGTYTLAHELGHTFGCAHDRGNSSFAPYRYAWGYSFAANATTYGTIMSYTGVNFIPQYSNPTQVHAPTGHAMGTPLADPLATHNALTIATTHWTIASYRDAPGMKDCNGNGVDDATDIANGTAQDLNGNCRPDDCEQRLYVDASNTGTVDGLSWNTAWKSLADALAFAGMKCSNVSEIWVADGTYKPDAGGPTDGAGNRFASFQMRSGLAVIGGFQGKSRPGGGETAINQRVIGPGGAASFPSILSGDINTIGVDTDNSYNVVYASGTGANAVLDGFTVERGYQDFDGGGMYAGDSSVTVRNCTFRNNRGGGGAAFTAYGEGSSPTITNCTFFNNTTPGSGGAVGSRAGAHVTLDGCTVHDCTATYGGAVATSFDSALTIRNSLLENNTAVSNSGAIDCYTRCTLTVENTIIRNNHGLASGAGGALVHTGCAATFTNCTFSSNTCVGAGGAVWVDGSAAVFAGCILENNTAAEGGGAIAAYSSSDVTVEASTLRGNNARWGGGITSNDSTLAIRGSILEVNHATEFSGGAIDVFNNATTLTNALLRANTAADGGAGLSLGSGSTAAIANCTIYGNSAVNSGGGIGMFQATLDVSSSILYGNTAANTPGLLDKQLTVFSGTRAFVRSCVEGGGGAFGSPGQLGGFGNIGGNPMLTAPAAGDLTLTSASPCIDAGTNTFVPPGTTIDLAGNPRFVDDPAIPDTGTGPAPIVDMGAYEFIPAPPSCPADLGVQGGGPGSDGQLDNNDFIAFINYFFNLDAHADLGVQGGGPGSDGQFDNNDFIAFINFFFAGC